MDLLDLLYNRGPNHSMDGWSSGTFWRNKDFIHR